MNLFYLLLLFGALLFQLKESNIYFNLNLITLEPWIHLNFLILNRFWFSELHHTEEDKPENVDVLEEEIDAAIDQNVEGKAELVHHWTAGVGEAGFCWESLEGEASHQVGEEDGGGSEAGGEQEKSNGEQWVGGRGRQAWNFLRWRISLMKERGGLD